MEKSSEQAHTGNDKIKIIIIGIVLIVLFIVLLSVHRSSVRVLQEQIEEGRRVAETLRQGNQAAAEKIDELEFRDGEQDKELAAMSQSLTAKTDELTALQEEVAARYIPNVYPLRGTSSLLMKEEISEEEDSEVADPEEDTAEITEEETQKRLDIPEDAPSAVFSAAAECRAIATAEGTVVAVTGNADKGYQIVLDHGNGYTTVYEGFGVVLVNENDVVGRGSVLLYFVDETSIFTYWIRYGESWLDPLDNIDVNG